MIAWASAATAESDARHQEVAHASGARAFALQIERGGAGSL